MQWMGIRVSNEFLPSSLTVSFVFPLSPSLSLSLFLSLPISVAFFFPSFSFPAYSLSDVSSFSPSGLLCKLATPDYQFLEMPQAHGTPAEWEAEIGLG